MPGCGLGGDVWRDPGERPERTDMPLYQLWCKARRSGYREEWVQGGLWHCCGQLGAVLRGGDGSGLG